MGLQMAVTNIYTLATNAHHSNTPFNCGYTFSICKHWYPQFVNVCPHLNNMH